MRVAILVLPWVVIACAAPAETSSMRATASVAKGDCFSVGLVTSHDTGDTVGLRAGLSARYDVGVSGACRDAEWTHRLLVQPALSSRICAGALGQDDARRDRSTGKRVSCQIENVRRSPPE